VSDTLLGRIDLETRPAGVAVDRSNRPAVGFGDRPNDREAEAGARAGTHPVLEQFVPLFGAYSGTIVGDVEPVVGRSNTDRGGRVGLVTVDSFHAVGDRVLEEVLEDALESAGVAAEPAGGFDLQVEAARLNDTPRRFGDRLEVTDRRFPDPRAFAGQSGEVVGELAEPLVGCLEIFQ